jgi:hypothetical protein
MRSGGAGCRTAAPPGACHHAGGGAVVVAADDDRTVSCCTGTTASGGQGAWLPTQPSPLAVVATPQGDPTRAKPGAIPAVRSRVGSPRWAYRRCLPPFPPHDPSPSLSPLACSAVGFVAPAARRRQQQSCAVCVGGSACRVGRSALSGRGRTGGVGRRSVGEAEQGPRCCLTSFSIGRLVRGGAPASRHTLFCCLGSSRSRAGARAASGAAEVGSEAWRGRGRGPRDRGGDRRPGWGVGGDGRGAGEGRRGGRTRRTWRAEAGGGAGVGEGVQGAPAQGCTGAGAGVGAGGAIATAYPALRLSEHSFG